MNNILPVTHDAAAEASLDGLATTLAWFYPEVWPRLKLTHVADRTGHCQECTSHATGSPVWPCRLRTLADEAERVTSAVVAARTATVVRSRVPAPSR